jgi:stage III sporulation protein SpoIIIAA
MIGSYESEEGALKGLKDYFGHDMRLCREKLSIFEQYQVRPVQRVFIPKIWSYRIVVQHGKWNFGTVGE